MARVTQSIIPFCQSTWYVLGSAAMTIWNPDPFLWLRERQIIPADAFTEITSTQRQLAFAAALVILMFVWFHRQRVAFELNRPKHADMPMHEALRYIAKHSQWAASSRGRDQNWYKDAGSELLSRLRQGHLLAWGKFRGSNRSPDDVEDVIPVSYLAKANGNWDKLVAPEPPTHLYHEEGAKEGAWLRVRLCRDQVEGVWPRRSLLAKLLRRSPVERVEGYRFQFWKRAFTEPWKQQDAWYREWIRKS